MAFNLQTFKTRTLTAAVFVIVMLLGLLWNQWSFFILFSVIHFGCWIEYLKLIERIRQVSLHPYIKLGLTVIGYGLMIWFCGKTYNIRGYGLKENLSLPISIAGFVLLLLGILQTKQLHLKAFSAATLGLVYISLSWGLLISLFRTYHVLAHDTMFVIDGSVYLPLLIIISIWINDTMAYIVGSMIGKTPLSKISPKKTWEGTIGGIILSIALIGLVSFYGLKLGALTLVIIIITAIASITGTIGDLFESKLKRMANVKDSGHIMPGHGGFLDRFDSLLFASVFVWLYVQLVML